MAASQPYWIGLGDIHGDFGMLGRIPGLPGAAGVLVSGDLTIRGGPRQAMAVIEAIARINPKVLAVIGNMDEAPVEASLDAAGYLIQARARQLAPGLGVMGVGWSTPTPFGTPSETGDATLARWLDQGHQAVKAYPRFILICHTPPVNTATDIVAGKTHVGSPAVRDFIERARPDVCLTGHIHESRGLDRIGETIVVNPGTLASGGYALISWSDGRATAELGQA